MHMYSKLLSSFVGLFVSRGYSLPVAKINASITISIWLSINVASALMLLSELTGKNLFWFFHDGTPYQFVMLVILIAWNWVVAHRLSAESFRLDANGNFDFRRVHGGALWRWYVVASALILLIAVAIHVA